MTDTMTTAHGVHPDRDLRQRDIIPPAGLAACHVLVIGVGAIGRQVAIQLAATGVRAMDLVDDDTVGEENLAPQAYWPTDIGRPKVEATADICRSINPAVMVTIHPQRFRRSSVREMTCFRSSREPGRVAVFTCVDSITTRALIWETVRERAAFFADGRMSAEVVRVLSCERSAGDRYYPTTLFGAEQAYAGSCTAKSTVYTASIAAGLMLSAFTRWLRGMPVERDLVLNLLSAELATA
jgi:sulfur carrier protein ThiS adenylyltransferase